RHTRLQGDWSSDVCSSDLEGTPLHGRSTPRVLTTYRQLSERGELTAHVVAFPQVFAREPSEELARVQRLREQFKNVRNLAVSGVKIFADGVVEFPSQTAAMSKPYRNSGKSGE